MANINQELNDILNATYGEEVRGSIYQALFDINVESTNANSAAISASDSASASAQTATQKAAEALASSTSAKNAENNAKESENQAKYWADQAEGSVSGVATFNGRRGYVEPTSGDYDDFYYTKEQVDDKIDDISEISDAFIDSLFG